MRFPKFSPHDKKYQPCKISFVHTEHNVYIYSKTVKVEKKELVIPLIPVNRWRHARRPDELEQEPDIRDKIVERLQDTANDKDKQSPEDEAVKELLQGMIE